MSSVPLLKYMAHLLRCYAQMNAQGFRTGMDVRGFI